ncbi:acyl carrier protein [Ruminiclostridium cellobioparum]|uniref:Phosphopantetheine attachment site n=1 Tax=Ruminiclostridium cellobioparum subsp. termitidis CT1112 TaxID=1195236 RepID=S0FQJ8_RUMCE|nr:acyl carrier protein [Ruminiclostridium cellobioparum]EMS71439.1 Phosphopantetheine attachment site [Ruminiclostridium cellobioparum subsp. termitidis CT1112]
MVNKDIEIIIEKVKEIIVDVADFELNVNDIQNGKDSIKNLGLNSLGIIRMLVGIEKEFDVEIDLEETESDILASVEQLSLHILNLKHDL